MIRTATVLFSLASLLVLGGCGDSKGGGAKSGTTTLSKASTEAAGMMAKITGVLEGVKDKDTASKAAGELDGLVGKLSPVMDKVKSLMAKAQATAKETAGAAGGGVGGLTGTVGKAAGGLADKASGLLSGGLKDAIGSVTKHIQRISQNQDMLGPLKGAFDKIKGMLPATS